MTFEPPPYIQNPPTQRGYGTQDASAHYSSYRVTTSYTNNHDTNSERNGLLPNNGRSKTSYTVAKLLGIFIFVCVILSGVVFVFYPSDVQAREKIRREWEAEERGHQIIRDAWISERKATVVEREAWEKERAEHNLEREAMAAEREQWRKQRADHENRERQEEEEKRGLIIWQDLTASSRCLRYGTREYSATLANIPFGLDPLKECWKKSIDIHGRQVFPSRCDTQVRLNFYPTLEVSLLVFFLLFCFRERAGLLGATGLLISAKRHALHGGEGMTIRYFSIYLLRLNFLLMDICCNRVASKEESTFVSIIFSSCNNNRSFLQRYESILENLQNGDDWHEMCATTPGRVQGRYFDGPTSCASWVS